MKLIKILSPLVLMLVGLASNAQIDKTQNLDSTKFICIEVMPEFPKRYKSLPCYIEKQLNFDVLNSIDTVGRSFYTFEVDSVGDCHFKEVYRSIDTRLDSEMERIINSLPRWKPGRNNNKPCSVRFTIPMGLPFKSYCND